jgi:hypothetical protein
MSTWNWEVQPCHELSGLLRDSGFWPGHARAALSRPGLPRELSWKAAQRSNKKKDWCEGPRTQTGPGRIRISPQKRSSHGTLLGPDGNPSRRACNRLRHSKTIEIDRETPFSSNKNDPPSVLPCCTMPHPDPNRPKLDSQLPPLRRNLPLRPMQIARLSRLARSKRAASLEAALSVCCHLHSMSASPLISPVENQYFGTPRHWLVSGDWARQGQRSDVDDSPLEGWRRRLHGFSTSPELRKNDDFPGHPKIVV